MIKTEDSGSPRWTLREVGDEERDSILALRRAVFSAEDPEKQDPAFWRWEFVENSDGRARLFVASDGDRIVGHYAVIPQDFSLITERVKGSIVVDVMTHPDYRFQGMFRKIGQFSLGRVADDIQFATGYPIRKEVMPGHLSIGWTVRLKIPVLVRPLDWTAVARRYRLPFGRTVRSVAERWRRTVDAWSLSARANEEIRPVRIDELRDVEELCESALSAFVHRVRSEKYLRWRYHANPSWRYALLGFWRDGVLQAFVALRRAKLLNTDSLAVVDAACRDGETPALVTLLRHAIREGTADGLAVAGAMVTTGNPVYRALRRCGFYPGPHRFSLILYAMDSNVSAAIKDPENQWFLMWGDTDDV